MSVSMPPSESHRCPTCKSASVNARNLAVFIDGTSNKFGDKETNVFKLYNLVSVDDPELKQRACYLEGIGDAFDVDNLSLRKRAEKIYSQLEMASARNVKKNVMEAYRWLVDTYQKGDQIYLFGYSQGAYQVRALASMIHEVGLLEEKSEDRVEPAYHRYLSIDPNKLETRNAAVRFKRDFCYSSVRIHFVGVWDTVSSLGLIKQNVHLTALASATLACHFRRTLALDEHRVNFVPECFLEVNAHGIDIKSQRSAPDDVKGVCFAACHSHVGGTSKPHIGGVSNLVVDEHNPVHVDNLPLLWMRREAHAEGLVFQSKRFAWYPEDVDLSKEDMMQSGWKFLEILPIHHQISSSGISKHERRWHLSPSRLAIPRQHIHFSVFPGDVYTPRATLAYGIRIPTVPRKAPGGLWMTELLDEGATLTSLLSGPQDTLKYLGEVLLLLYRRLDNGQTIPSPQWSETFIRGLTGFSKFALTVIYDVTSSFSTPEELVRGAQSSLCAILSSPEQVYITRILYVLQFSIRHRTFRQRFIAHKEVIGALMHALESATEARSENLFPLVMDTLCYLIDDDDQRGNVIDELKVRSDGTKTGKTRLSSVLEVKAPSHLMASLRMLASLARYQSSLCEELKPRITDLAKKGSCPVDSAAVETLVALDEPQVTRDVRFSTILGYLDNTLPRLDAEVGSTYSHGNTGDLPPVLRVNGPGELYEEFMHELLRSMESHRIDQRTRATLTLLKLCNNTIIQHFCSRNKVSDIFMRQLERKGTSLLAAYALKTCLKDYKWTPSDFDFCRAARLIVAMINKGWFDDAVGEVEGSKVFDELMTSGYLGQQVIYSGVAIAITKKFEGGERHEVRMGLMWVESLGRANPAELTHIVYNSLTLLRNEKKHVQMKGVKILSTLAQTAAGEQALEPHVTGIVSMLVPPPDRSLPRPQLWAPTIALYGLCKNETLRNKILTSSEFSTFKNRRTVTSYPQT